MTVEVNYVAVVLAAASSMAVGYIWYAPKVFGNRWSKLTGITQAQMKKGMARPLLITFAASLITAYILAHITYIAHVFFKNSYLVDSVTTAFWLWLGLTAARILVHDVFERRDTKLTLLNIANEFAILLVMGVVIGLAGIHVAVQAS